MFGNKLLLLFIIICMVSCGVPYSTYNYDTPRYIHYPYIYQPTRTIIVKQKHSHKHKSNKRHIKIKINKHRKTK